MPGEGFWAPESGAEGVFIRQAPELLLVVGQDHPHEGAGDPGQDGGDDDGEPEGSDGDHGALSLPWELRSARCHRPQSARGQRLRRFSVGTTAIAGLEDLRF